MLNHGDTVVVQQVGVFVVGQVRERVNLCVRIRHPVGLRNALLFNQRVVEHVVQHAVSVQTGELVMDERRRLLGAGHVLWPFWRELNRLCCAKKHTHQGWLHRAYSIPYLCRYDFAAAVLVANVHFAVIIPLGLDAILADLAFHKVHGIANGRPHKAFDLVARLRLQASLVGFACVGLAFGLFAHLYFKDALKDVGFVHHVFGVHVLSLLIEALLGRAAKCWCTAHQESI